MQFSSNILFVAPNKSRSIRELGKVSSWSSWHADWTPDSVVAKKLKLQE